MPVTMAYAGALALLYLVLCYRVVQARGQTKVSMGDGGNELMVRRMRGQANFAEYVPLVLLLLVLLEQRGVSATVLHALGGTLLVARLLHGYAFAFTDQFRFGRFVGTLLTFLVLAIAGVLCLWRSLA